MQKLLKTMLLAYIIGFNSPALALDGLKVATTIDAIRGGNFTPITNVLQHYITKKNIGTGMLTYTALFCGGLGMILQKKAENRLNELNNNIYHEILPQYKTFKHTVNNITKHYILSRDLYFLSAIGMALASSLYNNNYMYGFTALHILTLGIRYAEIIP